METILNLKRMQHGNFKDGRAYQITSIPQISVNTNGELKFADIEMDLYERGSLTPTSVTMRLSEFLENVANVGNLFV